MRLALLATPVLGCRLLPRLAVVVLFKVFNFEENFDGPVGASAESFGANLLLAGKVGFDAAMAGAVLFAGLVVSRLLEIVFSGIRLEPVAFNLGIPFAKRPPRPRGAPPPKPPPELPVLLPVPPLGPEGAVDAGLGLSAVTKRTQILVCWQWRNQ